MIEIIPVINSKLLRRFIGFPYELYKNDLNFVPPLLLTEKDLFNRKKNPFFLHSKANFYIAVKGRKTVGRIAAIYNQNHLKVSKKKEGFFGFFESINEYEVAEKLFEKVRNWLRSKGVKKIIGPENYTTNEVCGSLIKGFDDPPVIMMPYNKSYYKDFYKQYGWQKIIDLYAYKITPNDSLRKLSKIAFKFENTLLEKGIKIRKINLKNFTEEIPVFWKAYNSAFKNNWGFVPPTKEEFFKYAEQIKMIIPDKLMLFAEKHNQIVGFICVLPDINQILIKIRNGRLFPTGIIKYIRYKNKINRVRILIIGVIDEYRNMGIDLCFYAKIFETCSQLNIIEAEASYIMDNNETMINIVNKIGGAPSKKYRLFELEI